MLAKIYTDAAACSIIKRLPSTTCHRVCEKFGNQLDPRAYKGSEALQSEVVDVKVTNGVETDKGQCYPVVQVMEETLALLLHLDKRLADLVKTVGKNGDTVDSSC